LERERQVQDGLLLAGKSNKTIAYHLSLSPRTIEGYRADLMTKLEADSLATLIRTVLVDPSAI
jgi:two-component system, LuxR family, response regulator FixJ